LYVNKNWQEIQIKLLNVLLHCQNSVKAKFSISYIIFVLLLKVILEKIFMVPHLERKNQIEIH